MLNLNYIFFFFNRLKLYNTLKPIFVKNLNIHKHMLVTKKFNLSKKEFYLNYKIYWFKFINPNITFYKKSSYLIYLHYFFNYSNSFKDINLFNLNFKSFSLRHQQEHVYFINWRKKWIYNIKDSRKLLKNYFFFLKNLKSLTKFIYTNKNVKWSNLVNSASSNLLNLLIAYGFCYNFKSYIRLLHNKYVYINNSVVDEHYCFVLAYDVVKLYITNNNFKYLINNIYYNLNLKSFMFKNQNVEKKKYKKKFYKHCNFFFFNNSLNIKTSIEKNYLIGTFVKLNLNKNMYLNTATSSYFNITNIRLYNWLITN